MVDNENKVGLIARLAPVLGNGLHTISLEGKMEPPAKIPENDQEDFNRVAKKIAHALREYCAGTNKKCQHEDCANSPSRRIISSRGVLEIPGVCVEYSCGHKRVYEIVDESVPRKKVIDLYERNKEEIAELEEDSHLY